MSDAGTRNDSETRFNPLIQNQLLQDFFATLITMHHMKPIFLLAAIPKRNSFNIALFLAPEIVKIPLGTAMIPKPSSITTEANNRPSSVCGTTSP